MAITMVTTSSGLDDHDPTRREGLFPRRQVPPSGLLPHAHAKHSENGKKSLVQTVVEPARGGSTDKAVVDPSLSLPAAARHTSFN